MDPSLAQKLARDQDDLKHFDSKPVIEHGGCTIDLCVAVGDNAITPPGAHDQPSPSDFPPGCKYRFEKERFQGPDIGPELGRWINHACPGTKFRKQKDAVPVIGGCVYEWRCRCYQVQRTPSQDTFIEGKFTKDGVKPETTKQKGTKLAFERMANTKMKYSSGKKSGKKRSVAGVPPEPRKRVSDHRGGKPKYKKDDSSPGIKKRTGSTISEDASRRCHAHVTAFFSDYDQCLYLRTDSNFHHSYHAEDFPDASLLNENDINEESFDFMKLMFNNGIQDATIAIIMTELLNKQGKPGEFLASTIRNIHYKCQAAMDAIAGIDSNLTVAQRTLDRLDE